LRSWSHWRHSVEQDPHRTFFASKADVAALLERLRKEHAPLQDVLRGRIQRGVSPDVAAAHVVPRAEAEAVQLEKKLLRPSISGAQIKRYRRWTCDQFIIYTTRDTPIRQFPNALKYLERFRHLNSCKEAVQGKHPWWALHRPRDPQIFTSPKFVGLTTSKTIELVADIALPCKRSFASQSAPAF
jgi:hypothetical protein